MTGMWKPNDEKNEDEELTVTEHRDTNAPQVEPDDEQAVEMPEESLEATLESLGEDVASSPARRGQADIDAEEDEVS